MPPPALAPPPASAAEPAPVTAPGPAGGDVDRPLVVHPLLAAAVPILAAWASVADRVDVGGPLGTVVVAVAAAGMTWAALAWGLARLPATSRARTDRPVARSGLATTVLVTVLLGAGPLLPDDAPTLGAVVVLAGAVAAVAAAVLPPSNELRALGRLATVVAVVLAVPAVLAVVPATVAPPGPRPTIDLPGAVAPARDIFWIIPDRYPRADTLADEYGFDNTPFLDDLRARGFTVQDHARANYPRTASSLGSTLQLDYVQELLPDDLPGTEWGPVYGLIANQRLGPLLVDAGFDYVHLGTWWPPTGQALSATDNRTLDTAVTWGATLRERTVARAFTPPPTRPEPGTRAHYRAVSDHQFAELRRLARQVGDRPRLVVAHVTVPHEPHVYAADGSYVTAAEEAARSRVDNTVGQVRFVNDQLVALVDELVTGDPATDPVVVIQSDEGPHPPAQVRDGPTMDWFTATTAERAEKLRILSAWYTPGVDEEPPDDLTAVNTWRWLLDRYAGTEFGLLEDHVYVNRDQDHAYEFREVTDEFE